MHFECKNLSLSHISTFFQSSGSEKSTTTIDVSNLAKGIYILSISTDKNERIVKKLMK